MKCARALRVLLVHPRDIQAASASISSLHFKGLHSSAKLATGYTTRVPERKAQIAAVAQPAPTHALHPRARAPRRPPDTLPASPRRGSDAGECAEPPPRALGAPPPSRPA